MAFGVNPEMAHMLGGLSGMSMNRANRERQQAEEAGTEYQPWANIINPDEQSYYRRMGRQASAPSVMSLAQIKGLEEANPDFISGGWGAFGMQPKQRGVRHTYAGTEFGEGGSPLSQLYAQAGQMGAQGPDALRDAGARGITTQQAVNPYAQQAMQGLKSAADTNDELNYAQEQRRPAAQRRQPMTPEAYQAAIQRGR